MNGKYVAEIDSIYRTYDAKVEKKASDSARGPLPLNGVQNRHTSKAYDISIEEMLKSVNDSNVVSYLQHLTQGSDAQKFYQPVNPDVDLNNPVTISMCSKKYDGVNIYDKSHNVKKELISALNGVYHNDEQGWEVNLSKSGVDHAYSSAVNGGVVDARTSIEIVSVLPEIIKNAVLVESHPDAKQYENVGQIHRMFAGVSFDGEKDIYVVKLTVKELDGKHDLTVDGIYKAHDAKAIKIISDAKRRLPARKGHPNDNASDLLSLSLGDLLRNVTDNGDIPYLRQDGSVGALGSVRFSERLGKDGRPLPKVEITLSPDANRSTVFHEFGHWFFHDLKRRAELESATVRTKKDYATLKEWLGWSDDQTSWSREHMSSSHGDLRLILWKERLLLSNCGVFFGLLRIGWLKSIAR